MPCNGDPSHRFIDPLPREESWSDACESCEREVGFHEGPHAARHYGKFTLDMHTHLDLGPAGNARAA